MGRLKRPPAPAGDIEMAGERMDGGGFERLGLGHRRQDAGQTLSQHRLAGTRRARHQE